jgi:hypothetical protein
MQACPFLRAGPPFRAAIRYFGKGFGLMDGLDAIPDCLGKPRGECIAKPF